MEPTNEIHQAKRDITQGAAVWDIVATNLRFGIYATEKHVFANVRIEYI